MAFCEELTRLSREKSERFLYRLPTEVEWEHACRAGTTSLYSFGDNSAELTKHAWTQENSSGQPQPVGQLAPNAWGLCDMHGNVWEWCQDFYADDAYKDAKQLDPRGPEAGDRRSYRGHSFMDPTMNDGQPRNHRSACRYGHPAAFRYKNIGFRVLREVRPAPVAADNADRC